MSVSQYPHVRKLWQTIKPTSKYFTGERQVWHVWGASKSDELNQFSIMSMKAQLVTHPDEMTADVIYIKASIGLY